MTNATVELLNKFAQVELRENDVWCKTGSHWARPENCTSENNADNRLSFICQDHQ